MQRSENGLGPVEAVWVVDPYSGQQVDVGPFLKALWEWGGQAEGPVSAGGLELTFRLIRELSLMVHDPIVTTPLELSNQYAFLFGLYDVLTATRSRAEQAAEPSAERESGKIPQPPD